MAEVKKIPSVCIGCVWSCGMVAHVEGGRLVKVEGMPEHPLSKGYLCPRGEALPEWVYAPDRILYPMKKENGSWKRISWDEALDIISFKLMEIKEKYGAHSLAIFCGSIGVENLEIAAFARIFKGAFGTPNLFSVESVCYRSRIIAHQLTFGTFLLEEPEEAKCIILWGTDPDHSRPPLANYLRTQGRGKKIIVINPKRISLAELGQHYPVRPGSDCFLALSMANVIVNEGLYDKDFVEKYTKGFDQFKEHIQKYTPEKVSEVTGLSASEIRELARTFATNKPACIIPGTCFDQRVDGLQTMRAFAILQTITGNVDVKGSWVAIRSFPRLRDFKISVEEKPLGAQEHPLFYSLWGRISPYGQTLYLPKAILEEKPYPVKAFIVVAGNPVLSMPESKTWEKAFEKLDLLVVMDMFMTATAKKAHLVLPACSFLERPGLGYVYAVTSGIPYIMLRRKVIEPVGEAWPDWKFWTELGKKMGYGELFPWKTDEEIIDFFLEPMGLSYSKLDEYPHGFFYAQKTYDMVIKGKVRTPSGKIEIYSDTLAEHGYPPLPEPVDPPKVLFSTQEEEKKYPLWLSTGMRSIYYTHTQFRTIPSLRKGFPEPVAEINPETAKSYGINDGEMIIVETPKGELKIKAKYVPEVSPNVVLISHGWEEANVNLLTGLDPKDPVTGYPHYKALRCNLRKA